jgi:hypothetical protein
MKRSLFNTLTNGPEGPDNQDTWTNSSEFQWYLKWLTSKTTSVLPLLSPQGTDPLDEKKVGLILERQVLELMDAIAKTLSSSSHLPSLEDLRLKLSSQSLLKTATSKEYAIIILFSMIGSLTMLFQPNLEHLSALQP